MGLVGGCARLIHPKKAESGSPTCQVIVVRTPLRVTVSLYVIGYALDDVSPVVAHGSVGPLLSMQPVSHVRYFVESTVSAVQRVERQRQLARGRGEGGGGGGV